MKIVVSIMMFLISAPVFTQTEKIGALLEKGLNILYDHPDKAIGIGHDVLRSDRTTEQQKVEALLLISTGYSSKRDYAKSLEYAVKAAEQIPKSDNDAFKINAYCRLALQYQQLKIYNKAHSYLDKAISVADNSKQKFNYHKLVGFNYAIRGMVYKQQMSCDIASNYFNKSLYHHTHEKTEPGNYANISVILYNKGNCFLSDSRIDSARACYSKSFEYAEKADAPSLKAFANKGLAEVETNESNYKSAVALLLDAKSMAEGVGDLVLNEGIYNGLSENYLLLNDMKKYQDFKRLSDSIGLRNKQTETKTLNEFVVQIDHETEKEIAAIESGAVYRRILLALLAVASLLLLVFEFLRSKKKFKELKILRAELEEGRNR